MLQIIINKISAYIRAKNRWWIPIITGLLFSLSQPPFNHEYHFIFSLFPFLSFIVLIPLFLFATTKSIKQAIIHLGLFGFFASISQYYWIGFVTAEGLWHLILIGVVLISLVFGFFYLAAGLLFRFFINKLPRLYLIIFPAVWVCIDYARTLGEISFPWGFMGYSLVPFTPIIQIASITGVWGLTYIVVTGNLLVWELLKSYRINFIITQKWIHVAVFSVFLGVISIWGFLRSSTNISGEEIKVSLMQPNLDQLNFGVHSIDTAFVITDSMVRLTALQKPDLMIGPESALLCFLVRRSDYRKQVERWVNTFQIPILLGGLHWDKPTDLSYYEYLIYNSAFLFEPNATKPLNYNKIKLVPFSEALPFEGFIPILSRVNLGEADFQRGKEQTVFSIGDHVRAGPFICYEIIYPAFVRERVKKGANLIVTITNDGWFGKTSGPFQHAGMAQMRAVENGRPMVRSANSGISMIVDIYGRVLESTSLYTRDVLTKTITLNHIETFYSRWGDWFVMLCGAVILGGLFMSFKNMRIQNENVVIKEDGDDTAE